MINMLVSDCKKFKEEGEGLEFDHVFVLSKFRDMAEELLNLKNRLQSEADRLTRKRWIFPPIFDFFQPLKGAEAQHLKLGSKNLKNLNDYYQNLGDLIRTISNLLGFLDCRIGDLDHHLKNAEIVQDAKKGEVEVLFNWIKNIAKDLMPRVNKFMVSKIDLAVEFASLERKWNLDKVEVCRWHNEFNQHRLHGRPSSNALLTEREDM